jgi:ankyrin repeat protein
MVETQSSQSNLWTAAGEGDLDRVKHLIEVEGTSPNAKDQNGYTAIHAAVSWAHPTLLRYLLSKGGDINIKDSDGECVGELSA